jgi:predicted nucleic acid-binding protein
MNAVDTNVLLYVHDPRDITKQQRAVELLNALGPDVILLWQVACEYINASRKLQAFGLDYVSAMQNVRDLQLIWHFALPTSGVLERAVKLISAYSLSFWDAMIIAAAAEAGATRLYSEDLSMYPSIDGVQLVNPF